MNRMHNWIFSVTGPVLEMSEETFNALMDWIYNWIFSANGRVSRCSKKNLIIKEFYSLFWRCLEEYFNARVRFALSALGESFSLLWTHQVRRLHYLLLAHPSNSWMRYLEVVEPYPNRSKPPLLEWSLLCYWWEGTGGLPYSYSPATFPSSSLPFWFVACLSSHFRILIVRLKETSENDGNSSGSVDLDFGVFCALLACSLWCSPIQGWSTGMSSLFLFIYFFLSSLRIGWL